MSLHPIILRGLVALAIQPFGVAQAPSSASGSNPYAQNLQGQHSLAPTRGRFINPDFKIVHLSGTTSVIGKGLIVNVTADPTGFFIPQKKTMIADLTAGNGFSQILLSKTSGITCLRSDFYYQLAGNSWNKVGVVPSRHSWSLRWGAVEALEDGNLVFITGNENKVEVVDPGNWRSIFSAPYGGVKGTLASSPTPFREPVSTNINNKILIFFPFSPSGEVLLFDGVDHSFTQIPTPWGKSSKGILTSANGKRHSDRPVIAQWFPIDGDTVGFQGVNGETWYGYVLSIKTLTWRPWAVQHDGWTEPYGIPVENHRFMNLDSFVSFK